MKLKEFFKTCILTGLVILSVFLASKIWFSEELWSDGYNSFSYATIFPSLSSCFGKTTEVKPLDYNQIFFPKQIMLQNSGASVLIKPTDDGYMEMNEEIKKVMEDVFEGYEISEITDEDFKRECKSASVLVDFYNNASFKMLGDYFGASSDSSSTELNNIRQILISADETAIFARDISNSKIFKLVYESDISKLAERILSVTESASEQQKVYSYAFENGFDIYPEDGNMSDKMLFDSYIIINISDSSIPVTEAENLISGKDSYSALLDKFDISMGTSRAFTDSEGAVNFVENFARAKIHKDGYFEYDCMDPDKGPALGTGLTSDYDIIKKAGEFLEKVNTVAPHGEGNGYVFNRITKNGSEYEVYFDITYNGIPVMIEREGEAESSVKITVENFKITSYRQSFLSFREKSSRFEIKNMINALDDFYSVYHTDEVSDVKISDMYNTYYYKPSENIMTVKWIVPLSNNEYVIVNGI